jgi:HK97 family phage prohead protease
MKNEHIVLPFELKGLELKEDGGENTASFKGYAAAFGNVDLGNDIIIKGAFTSTIAKSQGKVPIQLDHHYTIKDNAGFGVSAIEDDNGLFVEGSLNLDKEAGREAYSTMKQAEEVGAQLGLSIGYRTKDSEYDNDMGIRKLKEVDLKEYSVTLFPMNPMAMVTSVKSVIESDDKEQISQKKRELENMLRDAGCSHKQALKAVSAIFEREAKEVEEKGDESTKEFVEELNKWKTELEKSNV